ncbi:MAG TPA: TolC family protein [Anaeromyxobacter sp.]|nr:TolC family protein [Anaeromyxobacter sp.]
MRRTVLLLGLLLAKTALAQTSPPPSPAAPASSLAPAPPPPAPSGPPLEAVDFDRAVQLAIARAPSATIAAQEVARTDALLWEVRSGSLPFLALNGTYTRIDASRLGQVVVEVGQSQVNTVTIRTVPQQSNNENLALSVPLLAPSRWYQWSHAGDQLDVARASERDVRRAVAITAARAYLTIIAQKRSIEVSRTAVENSQAHYDYAHARRLTGIGNTLDEIRADQQLATSRAQLEDALAGLVRAQEALGIATGSGGPLDAGGEPDLSGGPASVDGGLELVEETRTDVLLARSRSHAAERVTADSWADWLPTVSFNGQIYRQDPPSATTPARGWQVQLLLTFPIFEGGLRVGQYREREALEREAQLQLEGTREQARSDVRTAYANLEHAVASLEANRRAADSAHLALSLVDRAFRAGATTSLDVTDAERTARDADSATVIAEDGVRQSRLDLLSAIGRFPSL